MYQQVLGQGEQERGIGSRLNIVFFYTVAWKDEWIFSDVAIYMAYLQFH